MMDEWIIGDGSWVMAGGGAVWIVEEVRSWFFARIKTRWKLFLSLPGAFEIGNVVIKLFPDRFGMKCQTVENILGQIAQFSG